MKIKMKRVISLLLCLVILCCPFLGTLQQARANPAVVWASAEALEAVSFVLGLLGISFATKGAMVEASNEYLAKNPSISEMLEFYIKEGKPAATGQDKLFIGATLLAYLRNVVIPSVKVFFAPTKSSVAVPIAGEMILNHKLRYFESSNVPFTTALDAYNHAQYDFNENLVTTVNGVEYSYYMSFYTPSSYSYYKLMCNGSPVSYRLTDGSTWVYDVQVCTKDNYDKNVPFLKDFRSLSGCRYGFTTAISGNDTTFLYAYIAYQWIDTNGLSHFGLCLSVPL